MGVNVNLLIFLFVPLYAVSAQSGYFWHVTDFHYDPTYWTRQLSCNEPVANPGVFGDYWCDSNWRLVSDSITNMARLKRDVDFIIWTGDSVAHISNDDTSLIENLEILQNITDHLKNSFPASTKFLPSLGNHDFYPSDQADVKQDEMYNRTSDVWKDWIGDSNELEQFMRGGFFSLALTSTIRLLSLNTNLYYSHNHITQGMEDPAGQFAWMESVLDNARQDGEKIIVTAHVTPGVLTPRFATWMYPDHQSRYVGILTKYSDIILASHYGHDHSDGFKIMQDEMNTTQAVAQFVAPSVTPWRFKAGDLTGRPHNPGIRLVEYDKQTGEHINYVQYYINLTDTNSMKQSNWSKLYDFKETYGVDNMSVESLRKIFDKMENDNDGEKLAQSYCNNAVVSKYQKECTKKNRFEIICGGIHYDITQANDCVDSHLFGAASLTKALFVCSIIPLLITISHFWI